MIERFKNGIFNFRTRQFGNVAEILIQKLYDLDDSKCLNYDKFDSKNNKRIEIKFSAVREKSKLTITADNIIEQCIDEKNNQVLNYSELRNKKFDCNIQQVKPSEFDILYYGLFCDDNIYIFKALSQNISSIVGYSNKQHRNSKDEGQFHINNKTLNYHIDNNLDKVISYKEFYNMVKK